MLNLPFWVGLLLPKQFNFIPALIAGAFSAYGAHKQQRSSAKMAGTQMAFQERMSSTAHQREVTDLKAAGLNPILSANTGASSPGGAMGQAQNIAGSGVQAALQQRLQSAAVKQAEAAADKTRSQINPAEYWKSIAESFGIDLKELADKLGIDIKEMLGKEPTTAKSPFKSGRSVVPYSTALGMARKNSRDSMKWSPHLDK